MPPALRQRPVRVKHPRHRREAGPAPRATVIVPIYNEERNLARCVRLLTGFFRARGGGWELLVVDDGSTDETPEILRRLRKSSGFLRVISLPRNRGKGAAVRAGLAAARGRSVIFTDCDLSAPPGQIPGMLRELEKGADVVAGSRNMPGSRLAVPQPFGRRLAGRVFNLAVRIMLGLRISDTQCGFKAFTRRAARAIARRARVDGWAFDVEILLIARRLGLAVGERPIVWSDNADSKVSLLRHAPQMLGALFSLKRRFRDVIAYHPARALPLILASCFGAVVGQILYKRGALAMGDVPIGWDFVTAMISNRFILLGLLFFSLSAITWILALSRVDLSFAFPMLSLNFVFTALYAWLFFGEHLSVNRVGGIALVVAGVIAIAASGGSPRAKEARLTG